jgi:hypothetical protein
MKQRFWFIYFVLNKTTKVNYYVYFCKHMVKLLFCSITFNIELDNVLDGLLVKQRIVGHHALVRGLVVRSGQIQRQVVTDSARLLAELACPVRAQHTVARAGLGGGGRALILLVPLENWLRVGVRVCAAFELHTVTLDQVVACLCLLVHFHGVYFGVFWRNCFKIRKIKIYISVCVCVRDLDFIACFVRGFSGS